MLRVGICEDELDIVKELHDMLVRILFSYTEIEIIHYMDGLDIIERIQSEDFHIDLLFLDIHMKNIDGMQTAQFIRKHQIDVDIIFLTVSKEHVFDGYNYKAFAYCLKPLEEEKIAAVLHRYMEERKKCADCLNVIVKGKEQRLPLDRIIYFESQKRKIIAYTLTDRIVFYAKLDEIENLIKNKGFLRCHQSYMVNQRMIDSVGRTVIVVQGIHVPMSRKYYEGLGNDKEDKPNIRVTQSLALNQECLGAIVFSKGKLIGTYFRINSNKEIRIGRDAAQADIVINDKKISRLHCGITYDNQENHYLIQDYSKNGIFLSDGTQIPTKKDVVCHSGDELWLGSEENQICLG